MWRTYSLFLWKLYPENYTGGGCGSRIVHAYTCQRHPKGISTQRQGGQPVCLCYTATLIAVNRFPLSSLRDAPAGAHTDTQFWCDTYCARRIPSPPQTRKNASPAHQFRHTLRQIGTEAPTHNTDLMSKGSVRHQPWRQPLTRQCSFALSRVTSLTEMDALTYS